MTDRTAPRSLPAPRLDLDGAEWKLAIAAALAAVYTACWLSIRTPAPRREPPASAAPSPLRTGRSAAPSQDGPRAAAHRPVRIRTRSS